MVLSCTYNLISDAREMQQRVQAREATLRLLSKGTGSG